ncbi:PRKCA-binding protein isoform X2 [Folsomia candida]|uniref:PRKCA-binding protein isoform X2 n=1 Tax=Folsomia candida TaxID=158441 RepID=UPI000B8EEADF|nr:PRKCA-binding protein isoform X2 [Folsomia candida]
MLTDLTDDFFFDEDKLGLKITTGSVTIHKDDKTNMIGISIGGGAPNCPCLYIVQIFDNTPAAKDSTLQSGDEITAVNNQSVKGKTKVEVAKLIQAVKGDVTIGYNKLHAEASQGKSLDIILKKVKHRLVENLSSSTADALGLSRAILCNDSLVKKLAELEKTETMYRGMVHHLTRLLRAYLDLLRVVKMFAECFAQIGVREPQPRASLAFTQFADFHRNIEKKGLDMVKQLKPVLGDLGTYLFKAVPDTKLTIGKYADTKFEYLSFCLKVKELDDEEFNYASVQEPLYRVETGNYEYRLILRCRQEARMKFAQLRSDVQVKMELLDNKHVQDVATQLQKFSKGLAEFYDNIHQLTQENEGLFPVEVDLTDNAFIYEHSFETLPPDEDNPDEDGGTTSGGGGDNNAGGADIEYGTDEDLLVCRNLLDDE